MSTEDTHEERENFRHIPNLSAPSPGSGDVERQTFSRMETAKYLGVSVKTLDRMVGAREIHPGMRQTSRPRWTREYLDQWLRDQFALLVAGDVAVVRRIIARRLSNWAAPSASL
jgi:hypothetical protein